MGVCGSTPELGEWKECLAPMKWTEGNIWKLIVPLRVSKMYFKYKYVVVEGGKMVQWEKGIDRLADLAICPEINIDGTSKSQTSEKSPMYKQSMKQSMGVNNQEKLVAIHDNWEQIIIRFTIYTPEDGENDEEVVLNNRMGSTFQTMPMQRNPRDKGWLHYKYGKNVVPWECRLMVPNLDGNAAGEFTGEKIALKYNFE